MRLSLPAARKSALVNATTAGAQMLCFAACAVVIVGPGLVGVRWLLAAATAVARFFLNRHWAFAARDERKRAQGLRFALMSLASISLGTLAFAALLWLVPGDEGALGAVAVQLVSMSAVWLCFTGPATVGWVFRTPQSDTAWTETPSSTAS